MPMEQTKDRFLGVRNRYIEAFAVGDQPSFQRTVGLNVRTVPRIHRHGH